MYYKVITPTGIRRKFIRVDGDNYAEKEVLEYFFEGCKIELWKTYSFLEDKCIREVDIKEIREKAE